MAFPQSFMDELTARSDIVDVVGSYVQLTRRGSNLFGLCPFHSEKTGSFSVSPDKQIYYCFGCKRGGGVTIVNMDLEVEAQLGFFNSPIRAHGMCGSSKGDLFLMPLTTYDRHYLMKLARIR